METAIAIKERPILFSTPMVCAILEGRKTVTRRAINPQPKIVRAQDGTKFLDLPGKGPLWKNDEEHKCPYGKPGDIIWVRETHYRYGFWVRNSLTKKGNQKWKFVAENDTVLYFDNPPATFKISRDKKDPLRPAWYKRLGRFMPKFACRLRLEIQSIGVEPLQDITEEDAIREGCRPVIYEDFWEGYFDRGDGTLYRASKGIGSEPPPLEMINPMKVSMNDLNKSAKQSFESLWQSINGAESWNANPWVWRIEFRKT